VAIYGDRSSEVAAELAMHFEGSHDWSRAVEYLLQAAENAARRSAHHEASSLATRGLEVLKFLPETQPHLQQEMKLRLALGVSLMAIKGFASPEVEEVFAGRQELFWHQGPSPELFNMLGSLNLYYQFSGDIQASLKTANQLMQLGEDLGDGALIMEAHRAMGPVLLILGRCTEALEHLNAASALYATHHNHRYSAFVGLNCWVVCESYAARALWALGYPDKAMERTAGALKFARNLGHIHTLIAAEYFTAQIHHLRGEPSLVCKHAKAALELAQEYGLEFWHAYGEIELGWVEAEIGDRQRGIEQIEVAMGAYSATGAKRWSSYTLQLMADQFAKAGRVQEGFEVIEKALTFAEQSGKKYSLPELHRIKGELFLKSIDLGQDDKLANDSSRRAVLSQARACFVEALTIAKQQGTRSWQLRAALSMERLEQELGNLTHTELAEVYSSFMEGHETADLLQARTLLGSGFL
jgi:tetratricopeptide (TPR) repeat protein